MISLNTHFLFLFSAVPLLVLGAGGSITSNRYNDSLIESTPSSQEGFSASYGQLYLSSPEPIIFDAENEWLVIPFDGFGPSSNVNGSTTSPATITVSEAGVYQLNFTLYFSAELAEEGIFTSSTYTVGTSLNGGTIVPHAAIYAPNPSYFSITFNFLREFSANDYIRFYISSSHLGGGGILDNIVTLVEGNANLVQIGE